MVTCTKDRIGLAAVICAGMAGIVSALPPNCCIQVEEWSTASEVPGGPCAAGTIRFCETGNLSDPNGWVAGTPRPRFCDTYTPNAAGNVLHADCDTSPGSGWHRIGPPLADGQCCYVDTITLAGLVPAQMTDYSVVPCNGGRCCDGEPCP